MRFTSVATTVRKYVKDHHPGELVNPCHPVIVYLTSVKIYWINISPRLEFHLSRSNVLSKYWPVRIMTLVNISSSPWDIGLDRGNLPSRGRNVQHKNSISCFVRLAIFFLIENMNVQYGKWNVIIFGTAFKQVIGIVCKFWLI